MDGLGVAAPDDSDPILEAARHHAGERRIGQ
jgi:hypothetical protein